MTDAGFADIPTYVIISSRDYIIPDGNYSQINGGSFTIGNGLKLTIGHDSKFEVET